MSKATGPTGPTPTSRPTSRKRRKSGARPRKRAARNSKSWKRNSALSDASLMRGAARLGEAVRGRTAPNPNVGCVIVKDGEIVGRGSTAPGGRPHAEAVALKDAGTKAKGATLYTTLE